MRMLFAFLGRRAMWLLIAAFVLGIAWPALAALLAPAVYGAALASMFLGAVRLDWPGLARNLRRPGLALSLIASVLVGMPLAVNLLTGWALPAGSPLGIAMTLAAAGPPLGSAAAYAVLLGLDSALCLITIVPAMTLAPLVMPPLVLGLIGIEASIDIATFATRLGVMVSVSLAGGFLVRLVFGARWIDRNAVWIDGSLVLSVLVVTCGVMHGMQAVLLGEPGKALVYTAAAFALNIGMSLAILPLAPFLDRRRLLSAGLLLGNRNGVLLLASFGDAAGPDVYLFLVLIQIPLATMPLVYAGVIRLLLAQGPRK
jgi:BASS family bile acid:Na+ symporter